jgi:hypothetical protein
MRSHRRLRMLAAAAVAAGTLAPAAQAKVDNGPYPFIAPPAPHAVVSHSPGSTDWTLVGCGAAGGLALLGAGMAGSRRRKAPAGRIHAPRGA